MVAFGSRIARALGVLLLVAWLFADPTVGGDGGWINVPGGGGGGHSRQVQIVRPMNQPLPFHFAPNMANAIAELRQPNGGAILLPMHGSNLVVPATAIAGLAQAGVTELRLTVGVPHGAHVAIELRLDVVDGKVAIVIHPVAQ